MDGQVGPLSVLHKPFVRESIATKDELQPIPLQAVANGSVDSMHGRERAYGDTILLEHNLVLAGIIKLINLYLAPTGRDLTHPAGDIPHHGGFKTFDCHFGAQFWLIAARPPDSQRPMPAAGPTADPKGQ